MTNVSGADLELTFYTTYNPGVKSMTVAMMFDPEKFRGLGKTYGAEMSELRDYGGVNQGTGLNNETGMLYLGLIFNGHIVEPTDYTGKVEIKLHLEAKDGNAEDEEFTSFSAAVTTYQSITEDINIKRVIGEYDPKVVEPEIKINTLLYPYYRGDADGSGNITLDDVTLIQTLNSLATSNNKNKSVDSLNELIISDETYKDANNLNIAWKDTFNKMIRNVNGITFPCVESADTDGVDGITSNDASTAISAYSSIGSGIPKEEILQEAIKVVYY